MGFAALDLPLNGDVEIVRIMTHPSATGTGVARACTQTLLDIADAESLTVWLDVLSDAAGAIRLYESLGFVEFEQSPGTHTDRPAVKMRRLHPADAALRESLSFVPFVDASSKLLVKLADALDTPGCRRFMLGGGPHEMVHARQERDRRNQILHTVVMAHNQPVGWCGWARFELDTELVETITFLAELTWGSGLNTQIKHLQYQVATLGPRPLVFSVNEHNTRSIQALRKLWPSAPSERVWEPGADRYSIVITPTGPPRGYVPWPTALADPLAHSVADLGLPYSVQP